MALNGFAASLFCLWPQGQIKRPSRLWRPLFLPMPLGGWVTRKRRCKNTVFLDMAQYIQIFFVFLPRLNLSVNPLGLWIETQLFVLL